MNWPTSQLAHKPDAQANAWPEQQSTQWPQATPVMAIEQTAIVGISDGRITIIENDQYRFPTADDWSKLSEDQILMLWKEKQEAITAAKNEEMELRKHIVARAFPERHEGMNTKDLGEGYQLKAGVKFAYNLIGSNDTIENALDRISKIGNRGSIVAERLVSWKPSFLLQEYRLLQDEKNESQEAKEILKIVNEILEIKDASPTLEIKEPKIKK